MGKEFDCIKMKEDIQKRQLEDYRGLSDQEILKKRKTKLTNLSNDLGKFWKKINRTKAL